MSHSSMVPDISPTCLEGCSRAELTLKQPPVDQDSLAKTLCFVQNDVRNSLEFTLHPSHLIIFLSNRGRREGQEALRLDTPPHIHICEGSSGGHSCCTLPQVAAHSCYLQQASPSSTCFYAAPGKTYVLRRCANLCKAPKSCRGAVNRAVHRPVHKQPRQRRAVKWMDGTTSRYAALVACMSQQLLMQLVTTVSVGAASVC